MSANEKRMEGGANNETVPVPVRSGCIVTNIEDTVTRKQDL
jgi:hypothetical protein